MTRGFNIKGRKVGKSVKASAYRYEKQAGFNIKKMMAATKKKNFSAARTDGKKASGEISSADSSLGVYGSYNSLAAKVKGLK